MADWLSSMQQTFEYYIVDPETWANVRLVDNVISCTITRDADAETLGSATIDVIESLGECYIRAYLVTIQNGVKERHPLGTFLIQTPSSRFNGKIRDVSMDAYTPLLELKENPPPLGYYIPKTANIMDMVYQITRDNARAPIAKPTCNETLFYDFVAETNDTWLSFLIDLMKKAEYEYMLDEMGRILFAPIQETAALQPVWTYDDSNSSILYPDLDLDHDLYGIPNTVEVVYSDGYIDPENDNQVLYEPIIAINDDPNSPTSTVNRGRKITHRDSNPNVIGTITKQQLQEYANNLLKELSTLEYTISYKHGYCPVRVGDCVRLNYERAGLVGIKAKVISQSISCEPGCPVTEKAVFTNKLWR